MLSENSLTQLNFRDLQSLCKQRQLPATGRKTDLVRRVLESQIVHDSASAHASKSSDVADATSEIENRVERPPQLVSTIISDSLDVKTRLQMRRERFGLNDSCLIVKGSEANTDSEKLSRRAARFGAPLTSDRAF